MTRPVMHPSSLLGPALAQRIVTALERASPTLSRQVRVFLGGGQTLLELPGLVGSEGEAQELGLMALLMSERMDGQPLLLGRSALRLVKEGSPLPALALGVQGVEDAAARELARIVVARTLPRLELPAWAQRLLVEFAEHGDSACEPQLRPQRRALRQAVQDGCPLVVLSGMRGGVARALIRWAAAALRPGETLQDLAAEPGAPLGGVVASEVGPHTVPGVLDRLQDAADSLTRRSVLRSWRPLNGHEVVAPNGGQRPPGFADVLGESPALLTTLARVSARAAAVPRAGRPRMITLLGPSGVGKDLIARRAAALNCLDPDSWVVVNGASPGPELFQAELFGIEDRTATGVRGREGMIRRAGQGTLFLDELGRMDLACQALLLRVLQDGSYRPLGSTNAAEERAGCLFILAADESLEERVRQGTFLRPLWFRLMESVVRVPPLADRAADIGIIAAAELREAGLRPELPADLLRSLELHPWLGNVRELRATCALAAAAAVQEGCDAVASHHFLGAAPTLAPFFAMLYVDARDTRTGDDAHRGLARLDPATTRVVVGPPLAGARLRSAASRLAPREGVEGVRACFTTGRLLIGTDPRAIWLGEGLRWRHLSAPALGWRSQDALDTLALTPGWVGFSRVHLLVLFGDHIELAFVGAEDRADARVQVAEARGVLWPGARAPVHLLGPSGLEVWVDLPGPVLGVELRLRLDSGQLDVHAQTTPGVSRESAERRAPPRLNYAEAMSLLHFVKQYSGPARQWKRVCDAWIQSGKASFSAAARLGSIDTNQFARRVEQDLTELLTAGGAPASELSALIEVSGEPLLQRLTSERVAGPFGATDPEQCCLRGRDVL